MVLDVSRFSVYSSDNQSKCVNIKVELGGEAFCVILFIWSIATLILLNQ